MRYLHAPLASSSRNEKALLNSVVHAQSSPTGLIWKVTSLESETERSSVHATRTRAVPDRGPVTVQAKLPFVALSTGAAAAISSS